MSHYHQDTISSVVTAPGRAGVGIVRVSGPLAVDIAQRIIGFVPQPRHAHYTDFLDADKSKIDEGIALFFKGPHSFTGEDVLELQGHGGTVVLDLLLKTTLSLGARVSEPGEFTQRAFLNDKLDLAQAEAIADLIDSASEQAARSAVRSLQGDFSKAIDSLVKNLISLRMYVEAAIDFPEEEVDFLADDKVSSQLQDISNGLSSIRKDASQGALITEGINVVIAGRPNAGKSSLLNALAGRETAIVTDIEGTTRDVLKEQIHIDGMPLHIIDTAGLRQSEDKVEQIGIDRAWQEINQADQILLLVDASSQNAEDVESIWPEFFDKLKRKDHLTIVRNKIDLIDGEPGLSDKGIYPLVSLSAREGNGLSFLTEHLKKQVGFTSTTEGQFTARRRHLDALDQAAECLERSDYQLNVMNAGELVAEELRLAQEALGLITGKFTPDDLLGEIFSSFCIGK